MKISKELKFGFLLFIAIGLYFLLMEGLGFSDLYYLRILNIFIIIYGLNKIIKSNLSEGKKSYLKNLFSSGLTGIIAISLSILGLVIYLNFKDAAYIKNLSEAFLFGGNPSIAQYSFGLFIEGITSVLIVSFVNTQYWKTKNVFIDNVES
ncbi:hypothetical protein [Flavobacterium sp.]|uniref:hypothetical protein n=1 Tax=Flavobacterium sp. TaxID=239 RepID=UPI0026365E82|nr:hypothetical protein [Flavobacterium sp.]